MNQRISLVNDSDWSLTLKPMILIGPSELVKNMTLTHYYVY